MKNITDYFRTKNIKDFKNMKDYWNFYAAHVPLKSDKSVSNLPQALKIDGIEINDQYQMANEFNTFFTNLASTSKSNHLNCMDFIDKTFDDFDKDSSKYLFNNFKNMKTVNKLNITSFSFKCVDMRQLKAAFNEIRENSSPGVSKIPTKILKASIKASGPTLLHIFNSCISSNTMTDIFKHAECIPLHKKVSTLDLNNYLCISFLPQIA